MLWLPALDGPSEGPIHSRRGQIGLPDGCPALVVEASWVVIPFVRSGFGEIWMFSGGPACHWTATGNPDPPEIASMCLTDVTPGPNDKEGTV